MAGKMVSPVGPGWKGKMVSPVGPGWKGKPLKRPPTGKSLTGTPLTGGRAVTQGVPTQPTHGKVHRQGGGRAVTQGVPTQPTHGKVHRQGGGRAVTQGVPTQPTGHATKRLSPSGVVSAKKRLSPSGMGGDKAKARHLADMIFRQQPKAKPKAKPKPRTRSVKRTMPVVKKLLKTPAKHGRKRVPHGAVAATGVSKLY